MELSYATTVNEHRFKRTVTYSANDVSTGVVWSPGPLSETVWVLPYAGASQDEARVVHAPTGARPFWHLVEYRPGWAEEIVRPDYRHAPALSRKTWYAALGVTHVDQLAAS